MLVVVVDYWCMMLLVVRQNVLVAVCDCWCGAVVIYQWVLLGQCPEGCCSRRLGRYVVVNGGVSIVLCLRQCREPLSHLVSRSRVNGDRGQQ